MGRPKKQAVASQQVIGYQPMYAVGGGMAGELFPLMSGMPLLYDLKRMWLTDDTVGAMNWVIDTTISRVGYKFEACVDGEKNENDAEAVRLAKFYQTCLDDMNESFNDHAVQVMNIMWAGFAPFEIITKQRDGEKSNHSDMLYGIRKVPLRDPLTVSGWRWDEDQDVVAMHQSSAKGPLPVWKLLLFRKGATDSNPQGRPLLLGAHRPWRLKNRVQDSEAIGIERDLCGLPVFKVPEELLTQAEEKVDGQFTDDALSAQARIQEAIKAVKDMRFNRSGGLVMPSDTFYDDTDGDRTPKYDFKLVTTAGQRSIDTRTTARDYDRAIARICLMQFLNLGERSSGSYGLSDDQSSMAVESLSALANIPAVEWSRKVVPLLAQINGFDRRRLPKLVAEPISKEGLTAIGAFMRGLGALLPLVESDEVARREVLRIGGIGSDRTAQREAADRAKKKAENENVSLLQPNLPGIPAPGGEDQ